MDHLDYSYISARLKEEFAEEIIGILIEAGIGIPKHDLHATIIYDEREIKKPLAELHPETEFEAFVTKLDILGDGIVFHLTSPQLNEEFRRLTGAGYVHAYGTPLHHMSLGYDLDKYALLVLQSAFSEWGGKRLVFSETTFGKRKNK